MRVAPSSPLSIEASTAGSDGLDVADDDGEALAVPVFRCVDELVKDVAVEELENEFRLLGARVGVAGPADEVDGCEGLVKVFLHRLSPDAVAGREEANATTAVVAEDDIALAEELRR